MPDPRERDPRYPDRPSHPDFVRLSTAVQNHDAMAEQMGVSPFAILGVDEESFTYFLTNRMGIVSERMHRDFTNPRFAALYMDAFALGKRYAELEREGVDDEHEVNHGISFGEAWLVRIFYGTDPDNEPVADDDWSNCTLHGWFDTKERAEKWLQDYPDDTDIRDMDVLMFNKVDPLAGSDFDPEFPAGIRHDADGQPYLAYHDPERVLTFVWSGRANDEVQVSRESGEPFIAHFQPGRIVLDDTDPAALRRAALDFRRWCQEWARGTKEED